MKPRRLDINFENQSIDVIKKKANGKHLAFMVFWLKLVDFDLQSSN
jgi:hypothetical protein